MFGVRPHFRSSLSRGRCRDLAAYAPSASSPGGADFDGDGRSLCSPTAVPADFWGLRLGPTGQAVWGPNSNEGYRQARALPCAAGGCIGPDASPHCLHLFVGQCSFPRAIAHAACAALPDCHVLTCPRSLHVCQARRGSAVPVPSWGNDDVFADGTALQRLVNFAPAPNASACDARNVAAHSAAAVLAHASSVSVVACESAAEGAASQ